MNIPGEHHTCLHFLQEIHRHLLHSFNNCLETVALASHGHHLSIHLCLFSDEFRRFYGSNVRVFVEVYRKCK